MRNGLLLAMAFAALPLSSARASEGPGDVRSDHVDAFEDGGPRDLGLLANAGQVVFGGFGGEIDVRFEPALAVAVAGQGYELRRGTSGIGAALGLLIFPSGVAFRGFYLQPRLSWDLLVDGGSSAQAVGAGATLGWEWTLRVGFTVRLGVGGAYSVATPSGGASALIGLRPLADGSLGWLF